MATDATEVTRPMQSDDPLEQYFSRLSAIHAAAEDLAEEFGDVARGGS